MDISSTTAMHSGNIQLQASVSTLRNVMEMDQQAVMTLLQGMAVAQPPANTAAINGLGQFLDILI